MLNTEGGIITISQALNRAKIDDAILAPTVSDMEREAGTEAILTILLFELEKVNKMFNSNAQLKLTHEQCADIAVMLIEEFPNESLEDFVLSFRRGISGRYDEKLLRLDVQVIFRWVRCFLDEKVQRIEQTRKQIKDEEIKPYTDDEKENINRIIAESWVGDALREEQQNSEAYRKFKAEYTTKSAAKKEKTVIRAKQAKDGKDSA